MARDTLLAALIICSLLAAAGALALYAPIVAALKRADRQIDRWVEQDAPRP